MKIRIKWAWMVGIGILLLAGCAKQDISPAPARGDEMSIQITSTGFKEGGNIPRLYTCDDRNVSPPLAWSGVPSKTMSLAIILEDPDAPSGTFVHWVLFNLPPGLSGLEQGSNGGGIEGINDFRKIGYNGPCPPRGSNHRYYIKVYALDQQLGLNGGATKAQLENAMEGHILAQGQLMARYGR